MMPLYHVTLASNLESIASTGVDPEFSQGARKLSWWVTRDKLAWAIAHCSLRHDCKVNDLVVVSIFRPLKKGSRTRWAGVMVSPCNNRIDHYTTAGAVLERLLENAAV